jgi:hypothetical protein
MIVSIYDRNSMGIEDKAVRRGKWVEYLRIQRQSRIRIQRFG